MPVVYPLTAYLPTGPNIMPPNDLSLEAHWMPFTANRAFKAAPRMLVGAKDMHYVTDDNRKVLDGTS